MESLINGIAATLYDECECGCNNLTRSPEAKFLPGHDQRLVSRIAQDLAHARISKDYAKVTFIVGEQAQRWPNLSDKIENAAWKLEAKLVKARAKNADKFASHLAERMATVMAAEATENEFTVKVGRWEYPAKMNNLGLVWRNTKRDGSGEWIRHTEKGRYVSAA
jgi:hypothetical protein